MIEAGKQLSLLGEKLTKIQNANDESNAKLEVMKFEEEYSQKVLSNPDTANALNSIENDVRKNREQASKTIHNPVYRQEWLRKQEFEDQVYIVNQRAAVAKKIVSERKVTVLRDLELAKSDYRNAAGEQERSAAVDEMERIINNPANEDIYTAEDRKALLDAVIKQAQDDLKDAESLKKVKEKEFRQAEKEAINEREEEYVQMRFSGTTKDGTPISREDLISDVKKDAGGENPKVRPSWAENYVKALTNPKLVGIKTRNKISDKIIDAILVGGEDSQASIRLELIKEMSKPDPGISWDDYDMLSTFNAKVNIPSVMNQFVPEKSFFQSVDAWNKENAGAKAEIRMEMFRSYVSKIANNIKPEVASQEVIKEQAIKLHPGLTKYPKEGEKIMDLFGIMKLLTPDGILHAIDTAIKGNK